MPGGAWPAAGTQRCSNRPASGAGSSLNFKMSGEPGAPQIIQASTSEPVLRGVLGGHF